MAAEPVRRLPDRPATPSAALRSSLAELADRLLERPRPERSELLPRAQEAYRAVQRLGAEHGLLHLVLRNLVSDLLDPRATLDASYHANQLVRAIDLISSR